MNQMLTKLAQELAKRTPPHRKPATFSAYPDYSKGLLNQRHQDPGEAGMRRAVGTGITGAALGALVARLISDNKAGIAGGAALGGLAGGVAGYQSGKGEAESDYSKLLFLRRRLGVNEPGEHEALQKHPALVEQMIDKRGAVDTKRIAAAIAKKLITNTPDAAYIVDAGKQHQALKMDKKAALSPKAMMALKGLGVAGAAGGGYIAGSEGTSRLIGYHDDPAARHVGGYVNAANATAIALALALRKTPHGAAAMKALLHPGTMGAMAGMEVIPSALRSMNHMSGAQAEQAKGQIAPSVGRTLTTPTAQGAGVGAGLAGLAAVLSGMSRARSDKEIGRDTSRPGMIAKDFGKYVVPATIAGGVIGSLRKQ
jgi:hypothetical protein